MDVEVLFASAHQPFETKLAQSIMGASDVNIAVAFLSRFGVDFIRKNFCEPNHAQWQLVTSVRWPTDMDALSDLARDYPYRIWLHLGGKTPQERDAERYQLHSKLVICNYSTGNADVFIGSHNWTGMALRGLNLEIGVRIACSATDAAAIDAMSHWQQCQQESERFDPARLSYYKAIQASLHQNIVIPNPDFPDFEVDTRLVILAEAQDASIAHENKLRLTFSPDRNGVVSDIPYACPVDLYLYPKGCLFGDGVDSSSVVRYEGQIAMVNDNTDAPVQQRAVNTEITDLDKPVVSWLKSIDSSRRNQQQVIASLARAATNTMPIFHKGTTPKVSQDINFEIHESSRAFVASLAGNWHFLTKESLDHGRIVLKVPRGTSEKVELRVPHGELYQPSPIVRLESQYRKNHPDSPRRRSYILKPQSKGSQKWETRFVYLVSHREKLNE